MPAKFLGARVIHCRKMPEEPAMFAADSSGIKLKDYFSLTRGNSTKLASPGE